MTIANPGALVASAKPVGGKELARNIVHWDCQADGHRALRSRRGAGGLTVNAGAWAYCDGAGSDDAHHWVANGGVPLEALIRWASPNGGSEAQAPAHTAIAAAPAATLGTRKGTGVRRT